MGKRKGRTLPFPPQPANPNRPLEKVAMTVEGKAALREFKKGIAESSASVVAVLNKLVSDAQQTFAAVLARAENKNLEEGWRLNLDKERWDKIALPKEEED